MQRRNALKNMATGVGAIFALPLWANSWNAETLPTSGWLPAKEQLLLQAACEAILPKTTKYPGAAELKVHVFVAKMLEDCYDKTTQNNVAQQLVWLDQQSQHLFGKPFTSATAKQQLNILQSLEVSSQESKANVYKLLKNLTVQGYTTSEYYLTKVIGYELVPGRFIGCKTIQ